MGDSITSHGTSHGWGPNFLGMPRGPTPGDWQGLQPNGQQLPKLWILVDRYAAMPPVIENSDRGGPPQMTRLLSRFGASRLRYWIGELARHRCGYGLVQQWEVEVSLHVHAQGQPIGSQTEKVGGPDLLLILGPPACEGGLAGECSLSTRVAGRD